MGKKWGKKLRKPRGKYRGKKWGENQEKKEKIGKKGGGNQGGNGEKNWEKGKRTGKKWRKGGGVADDFGGHPVLPHPGYFMDHAVQLQDLPVRYRGVVSPPQRSPLLLGIPP